MIMTVLILDGDRLGRGEVKATAENKLVDRKRFGKLWAG